MGWWWWRLVYYNKRGRERLFEINLVLSPLKIVKIKRCFEFLRFWLYKHPEKDITEVTDYVLSREQWCKQEQTSFKNS